MSSRAPSTLAAVLGQIRYRLSLALIGFGLFMGCLLVCVIPLCIYASYDDAGGRISEPLRWAITGGIFLTASVVTIRYRGWIVRKALEEAPPGPVRIWTGRDIATAALQVITLGLSLAGLLALLTITALFGTGGYLLIAMLSVPAAVVIAAIIIALAIMVAAFSRTA